MRGLTTSGEYVGGPCDGEQAAIRLDPDGNPPSTITPQAPVKMADVAAAAGGTYEVSGKTDAGRHRYRWVPRRRPSRKLSCCPTPGPECPCNRRPAAGMDTGGAS